MKVSELLTNAKKTYFSFELLPPLKGRSIEDIYKAIDPLIEFDPININITYHQHETVFNTLPDGSYEKGLRCHPELERSRPHPWLP